MKTVTKIVTVVLIVIILAGIGAYAAYTYMQNTQNTQPSSTPTPSASPSPIPTASPSPSPSPTSSTSPSPTTANPTPSPLPRPSTLTVATTTSLHDTGLEDQGIGNLRTAFMAKYPWITLNYVALGTGAAIQAAQRGDADMILVHSPSQEVSFLSGGYGVDRKIIAYNFFVIVGPANDPAGISGMTNVSQALIQIYNAAQTNSQIQWFTRNDGSGTATAESNLWKAAGYNYTLLLQQTSWFHASGQGMGQTLLIANNGIGGGAAGYILSDMGTYLAYYTPGNIQLKIQIQAQKALLNVYSAIIDNPQSAALTGINFNAAMTFVNFLVSDEGQQLIGNYGVTSYNQSLFTPFVPLASGTVSNDTLLGWIKSYAYMNSTPAISASGTECPSQYRYNAGDLYSPSYDALANMNLSASISLPNYYSTDSQQLTLAQPSTYSQGNVKLNKE